MRRLPISLLLVVIAAIFGLGLALDALFERYNTNENDPFVQIKSFGQSVASYLNNNDSPNEVIAIWPNNDAFHLTLESREDLSLPPQLESAFKAGDALALESEEGLFIHYYLQRHDLVLSIQSDKAQDDGGDGMAWFFTSAFYIGTLAMVLLWLKPLLRRLYLLRKAANAFGQGQLDSRVGTHGVTYIEDIERDFNRMADQIQQLVEDNKLLTSAVSHDLRTPLARLRFGIDTLAETPSTAAHSEYLCRINRDLNEMESLVDSLLRYARLDNVMAGISKQSISLRSLINECVSQHIDGSIIIELDDSLLRDDDELNVYGCIEHLATVFNNLIQNALDYSEEQLLIVMSRDQNLIEISFCDDGPGIAPADHQQVMKPFERGTANAVGGYGLGLAVASRIVKHHNGHIRIASCERLGGAKVSVYLA